MTTPLVNATLIGQTVTFTSKNPTDPTTYVGIIAGIITYPLAVVFGFDIVSYNAAVQRVDTSVGDPTTLNYFVITLNNKTDQTQPANRLFASEWIATASFSEIQQAAVYNLSVYDIPAKGQTEIITILRASGYNAVPTSS